MFKSIVLAAFVAALAVNPAFAGANGGEGCHGPGGPGPSTGGTKGGGSPSPAPSASSAAPSAGPTGGAGQHTWEDWLPGDPISAGGKKLTTSVTGKNVLNGCGAKNKNCLW